MLHFNSLLLYWTHQSIFPARVCWKLSASFYCCSTFRLYSFSVSWRFLRSWELFSWRLSQSRQGQRARGRSGRNTTAGSFRLTAEKLWRCCSRISHLQQFYVVLRQKKKKKIPWWHFLIYQCSEVITRLLVALKVNKTSRGSNKFISCV